MCGCCSVFRPDHSCLDFTAFKPRAARTSFRSSGAAIHAPRDSLHSCSLIGQLFRSRERRDGVGSASNERFFLTRCLTRVTFDWKVKEKHVAHSVYELNMSRLDALRPAVHPSQRCIGGLQTSPLCGDDAVRCGSCAANRARSCPCPVCPLQKDLLHTDILNHVLLGASH